jgi:hypothetical protein
MYDLETGNLEPNHREISENVFVSREHARKFALEILAELERTESN